MSTKSSGIETIACTRGQRFLLSLDMSLTSLLRYILLGLSLLLWGCSSPRLMMPTPNVLLTDPDDAFQNLSTPQKNTEVELLYFTDRAPEQDSAGKLVYGYERSGSIGFGSAVVKLAKI